MQTREKVSYCFYKITSPNNYNAGKDTKKIHCTDQNVSSYNNNVTVAFLNWPIKTCIWKSGDRQCGVFTTRFGCYLFVGANDEIQDTLKRPNSQVTLNNRSTKHFQVTLRLTTFWMSRIVFYSNQNRPKKLIRTFHETSKINECPHSKRSSQIQTKIKWQFRCLKVESQQAVTSYLLHLSHL